MPLYATLADLLASFSIPMRTVRKSAPRPGQAAPNKGEKTMSLIKRESSPAQSRASRANSMRSTGPRSERGKAVSGRNLLKPRPFSQVVAHGMEALGERPERFRKDAQGLGISHGAARRLGGRLGAGHRHTALEARALAPRGGGSGGLTQAQAADQRIRAAAPPTGPDALEVHNLASLWGFTGIPDSAMKFQQVIACLTQLRDVARGEQFDEDSPSYFSLLYGESPGPYAAILRARFERVAKKYKEGHPEAAGRSANH